MKASIEFLRELRVNNNRDWFKANMDRFRRAEAEFKHFTADLIIMINEFDEAVGFPDPRECIFRIYRDVRFSKNKEPYKPNFGTFIARGGRKSIYAGYYFHLEAGNSFASGGIYMAEPPVMKRIRERMASKTDDFLSIVEAEPFRSRFTFFEDEKLKRVPRCFDKDSPADEFLKMRHITPFHPLSDAIVCGKDLPGITTDLFTRIKPLNDFLNKAVDTGACYRRQGHLRSFYVCPINERERESTPSSPPFRGRACIRPPHITPQTSYDMPSGRQDWY